MSVVTLIIYISITPLTLFDISMSLWIWLSLKQVLVPMFMSLWICLSLEQVLVPMFYFHICIHYKCHLPSRHCINNIYNFHFTFMPRLILFKVNKKRHCNSDRDVILFKVNNEDTVTVTVDTVLVFPLSTLNVSLNQLLMNPGWY